MIDKHLPVKHLMSRDVISVKPDTIMTDVAYVLRTNNLHHIPVVEDGFVQGMLSASDLHKLEHHFTLFRSSQAEETNEAILRSVLARDVMVHPVVTIREDDTVQKAADIFKENLFRALPVLDSAKKLAGIITPYDLMVYAFGPGSTAELQS